MFNVWPNWRWQDDVFEELSQLEASRAASDASRTVEHERALLDRLLGRQIRNAQGASAKLRHFAGDVHARRRLARQKQTPHAHNRLLKPIHKHFTI